MIRRFALSLFLFLICRTCVEAQSLSSVSPVVVESASYSTFTIAGTGLDNYDTFQISRTGRSPVPVEIVSQSATSVDVAANLAPESVGLYSVSANGPSQPALALTDAFELTRPAYIDLTRPTLGTGPYPFTSGLQFTNTQAIVLQEELGRGGTIYGMEFRVNPGSTGLNNAITIRLKHTTLDEFPSTSLDATGWQDVYTGSLPAPDANNIITINFYAAFVYDGVQNLMVSVVSNNLPIHGENSMVTFETGADRLISGRSNSSSPAASGWSGSVPIARVARTDIPRMKFYFITNPCVAAFSVSSQTTTVGVPVLFTSASWPLADLEWDFDGDGVFDSTATNPSHAWALPGVYTVEMICSVWYAQDSETKQNFITVSAPSGIDSALYTLLD